SSGERSGSEFDSHPNKTAMPKHSASSTRTFFTPVLPHIPPFIACTSNCKMQTIMRGVWNKELKNFFDGQKNDPNRSFPFFRIRAFAEADGSGRTRRWTR